MNGMMRRSEHTGCVTSKIGTRDLINASLIIRITGKYKSRKNAPQGRFHLDKGYGVLRLCRWLVSLFRTGKGRRKLFV